MPHGSKKRGKRGKTKTTKHEARERARPAEVQVRRLTKAIQRSTELSLEGARASSSAASAVDTVPPQEEEEPPDWGQPPPESPEDTPEEEVEGFDPNPADQAEEPSQG